MTLVLEVKGQDTEEDQVKRAFLDECVKAVNSQGRFGQWSWHVSLQPKDVAQVLFSRGA